MKERTALGRTQSLQGFHKESLPNWQGQSSHKDSLRLDTRSLFQTGKDSLLTRTVLRDSLFQCRKAILNADYLPLLLFNEAQRLETMRDSLFHKDSLEKKTLPQGQSERGASSTLARTVLQRSLFQVHKDSLWKKSPPQGQSWEGASESLPQGHCVHPNLKSESRAGRTSVPQLEITRRQCLSTVTPDQLEITRRPCLSTPT
jgi:hypothetical protein